MSTTDSVSTPAAKAPTAQPVTFLRWEWSRHAPGNPAVIVEYSVVFVRDGVAYHGYCQPLRNQPVPDDELLYDGPDGLTLERLAQVAPGNFDVTILWDRIAMTIFHTARELGSAARAGEVWQKVREVWGYQYLAEDDGQLWEARETFWRKWRELQERLKALD
jgi:hypothetical protein